MGFKMRRSGMSLRSTTRIQPQLTNLQSNQDSPLHQQEEGIVEAKFNPDGSVNVSADRQGQGGEIIETSYNPNGGKDPNWRQTCIDNPCLKPCNDQYGECPKGDSFQDEENYSLSMDTPETTGNILTPREIRRNTRGLDVFRRRQEDLIRRANKDYRQAIRRGEAPPPAVMKILSGEYLGDMDGVNIGQASTGTTNLFTGQKTPKFNPKNGGSEVDLNKRLMAETERIVAEKKAAGEVVGEDFQLSDIKEQAKQTVSDSYIKEGKAKVYDPGKHLSARSRRLSDNRGLTPDDFGDHGLKGRSQKKKDRDARKVTGYTEDLMKGVISQEGEDGETTYQYDPNNKEGMSKRKYDQLKRKITKKRGDNSAFKKKDSPINMTVNITKPSYKMGGFGSK